MNALARVLLQFWAPWNRLGVSSFVLLENELQALQNTRLDKVSLAQFSNHLKATMACAQMVLPVRPQGRTKERLRSTRTALADFFLHWERLTLGGLVRGSEFLENLFDMPLGRIRHSTLLAALHSERP